MKNIIKYSIAILAGAAVVACSDNQPLAFDDANAFVDFGKSSVSVDENMSHDGSTLKIPVTLASVAGLSETISFEVKDGTAKKDVNYKLLTTSGTISFDKENRTQNIEFEILDPGASYVDDERQPGDYTGDLSFVVKFASTGNVNSGMKDSCVVKISDLDHPLVSAGLIGTFSAAVADYWGDTYSISCTVDKDEKDVYKVWVGNLAPYFAANGFVAPKANYIYGTVSDDFTTITIPHGQEIGYKALVFTGFSGPDPDDSSSDVDIVMTFDPETKAYSIENAWGVVDPSSDGWWELYYGGIVLK